MSWSDDDVEDRLGVPDIREILKTGRSSTIEFFPDIPSEESELAKEACGLGNCSGGVILFGVDTDAEVKGIHDADTTFDKIAEIFEDRIEPDLVYDLYTVRLEEDMILISRIRKYTETDTKLPFAVDGQFFYRKAKQSHPMSPATVKELMIPSSSQVQR